MDSVLITGCSAGGLGSGLALAFQARNIHVFATARSLTSLSHLSHLPNVTLLELDVTNKESIAKGVETVKKEGNGKLKYLVNNAGRGIISPLLDGDEDEERKLWEVNYWGVLNVTRAFASLLVQERGVIINVGSGAGVINMPWNGIYSSSKAAVNLLSETLRLELEPLHVSVVTAVVGVVKSKFFSNLGKGEYELPEGSYYKSLEKHIGASARSEGTSEAMGGEDFGKLIVRDVLGGKRGIVYRGTLAWVVRWMWFVPDRISDWYCRSMSNLRDFQEVEAK